MRPMRSTGDDAGFWKTMDAKHEIHGGADGKEMIGHKSGLTFHEYVDEPEEEKNTVEKRRRKRPGKPTEWKMLEFVSINTDRPIDTTAPDPLLLNDCVLYKITNKLLEGGGDPAGLAQSTKEEEQEGQAMPDVGGEWQDTQLTEQQQYGEGAGPQDEQQQATVPQLPHEGDTAAAEALQEAAPGDFFHGAHILDDDQNLWGHNESQSLWDLFDTNMYCNFDSFHDGIMTACGGGGETQHERPAEQHQQQQAISGTGKGAGSRDEQQQATPGPANPNGGGAAPVATDVASQQAAPLPGIYDWKHLKNWGRPDTDSLLDFDFDDHIRAT